MNDRFYEKQKDVELQLQKWAEDNRLVTENQCVRVHIEVVNLPKVVPCNITEAEWTGILDGIQSPTFRRILENLRVRGNVPDGSRPNWSEMIRAQAINQVLKKAGVKFKLKLAHVPGASWKQYHLVRR